MRYSHRGVQGPRQPCAEKCLDGFFIRFLPFLQVSLVFAFAVFGQDVGSQEKEYLGVGSVIRVIVHDASGAPFSTIAVVKLLRGISPSGQQNTSQGVAEFVVTKLGEFTAVVSAPGYSEAQQDVMATTDKTQVDVYLRRSPTSGTSSGVPGRPVLTPKAKEAFDKGIAALKEEKLGDAKKYVGEAMRLAPGNPDVLYVQGVLSLKQGNWDQAQTVLLKATELDPNSARAFAALGMTLCNQGNYSAAIAPLTKSLQLDPAGTWETRWALAKSYYQLQHYDEALKLSQQSLEESKGNAPQVGLLVAQALTAVGKYEEAAQILRAFLRDYANRPEAATARRWLDRLMASGNIRSS